MSHTPGPWESDTMAEFVFAGNMMVCQIRGWGHLTGRGALNLPEDQAIEIQKANGRLIAAAPDLLESLIELRKDWMKTEDHGACDCPLCKADAAIAKATAPPQPNESEPQR